MCFSAGASFGASAVLATAGIATLTKVKEPNQWPFAAIPFLFAIQQFCEGVLWLAMSNPEYASWQGPAKYVFLVFAQVLWPLLVPLSIWIMEKEKKEKKLLAVLSVIGISIASYLAYCLISYPVSAKIVGYHISYTLEFPPQLMQVSGVLYFMATVLPPFVSTKKRMKLLGTAILASHLLSKVFFPDFVLSVWCFFAAGFSIIIYFILSQSMASVSMKSHQLHPSK